MGRDDDHLVEPLFAALREREGAEAHPAPEGEERVLEQSLERGPGGWIVRFRRWLARGDGDPGAPPPPRRG